MKHGYFYLLKMEIFGKCMFCKNNSVSIHIFFEKHRTPKCERFDHRSLYGQATERKNSFRVRGDCNTSEKKQWEEKKTEKNCPEKKMVSSTFPLLFGSNVSF